MTIKDRILEYLELKGISINKAESMLGWSKSAFLKSNNLSGERISEFVHKFYHFVLLNDNILIVNKIGDVYYNLVKH